MEAPSEEAENRSKESAEVDKALGSLTQGVSVLELFNTTCAGCAYAVPGPGMHSSCSGHHFLVSHMFYIVVIAFSWVMLIFHEPALYKTYQFRMCCAVGWQGLTIILLHMYHFEMIVTILASLHALMVCRHVAGRKLGCIVASGRREGYGHQQGRSCSSEAARDEGEGCRGVSETV
jgi:hypothetical protein